MEVAQRRKVKCSSYSMYCCAKGFASPERELPAESGNEKSKGMINISPDKPKKIDDKKPGGWRAMPFILGNETFERLASFGLMANFIVYLTKVFHMQQVAAANVINVWTGITYFSPLIGALIADTYAGRFKTIAFSSCASFLGMVILTLTAWLPYLHPPKCDQENQSLNPCKNPTSIQYGVLIMSLGFLTMGTAGIRPCSIPFGVDQFDSRTEEGLKGIKSFYNWYYMTFNAVLIITFTVAVYIQDSVSWVIGFGIPTVCMFCSIILFFVGTKIYVHAEPEGSSIFSGIAQVCVAAYKKRRLEIADHDEVVEGMFYDPPAKEYVISKLPLTNKFRFLNKAAWIEKEDLKLDGTPTNDWRLCSIQQVEEVKCLIKVIPIWASGIVSFTAITQQGTFTVLQALKMDRHLGPKFQIPAGSMAVVSMITIVLWLPFYDRVAVPALRKITKHEGGITQLQRMGVGLVFSILSMLVAGLIEKDRREIANSHPKAAPISVFWLAPQLALMGFCEAFNAIGQIEFFNEQFPEHMKSIANSLFYCSFAGANYLSSLVNVIVQKVTRTRDHPNWLANDLNVGKLDYFYFLLAGLGAINMVYFLFVARRYRYKGTPDNEVKSDKDLELNKISS